MASATAVLDRRDMLILRNDDEEKTLKKEVPGSFGTRHITIEPKQSALVPFEFVRVWWGDPRSKKDENVRFSDSEGKGFVAERYTEIQRLHTLYGTYGGDVSQLNAREWGPGQGDGVNPKCRPHPVSVFTQDRVPIPLPAFDESMNAFAESMQIEGPDLTDQVRYQEHVMGQMARMQEELDRLKGAQSSDVEVDTAGARS
jgi:hypothetical protein